MNIKRLSTVEEMGEVNKLMEIIWGKGNGISPNLLIAQVYAGAILLGGYKGQHLIAFSYGFPAKENSAIYLYSHALGVHPDYRESGVGSKLKYSQAEEAINRGYSVIKWTFDPLQSKNAYLNLEKLGAKSNTYKNNFYGDMNDLLNYGSESDRLIVSWQLDQDKGLPKNREEYTEICLLDFQTPAIISWRKVNYPKICIPVPNSLDVLGTKSLTYIKDWRLKLRDIFHFYFNQGYIINGFEMEKERMVQYYLLEKR